MHDQVLEDLGNHLRSYANLVIPALIKCISALNQHTNQPRAAVSRKRDHDHPRAAASRSFLSCRQLSIIFCTVLDDDLALGISPYGKLSVICCLICICVVFCHSPGMLAVI